MNTDRFKFRVWSKVNNRYEDDHLKLTQDGYLRVYHDGCKYDPDDEGYAIEQCTGLRDRNGILIFEGDVVRVEDDYGVCNSDERIDTGIGTVEWIDEMWYIAGDVSNGLYELDCTRYIEVIGNIHDDKFHNLAKLVYGKDGE